MKPKDNLRESSAGISSEMMQSTEAVSRAKHPRQPKQSQGWLSLLVVLIVAVPGGFVVTFIASFPLVLVIPNNQSSVLSLVIGVIFPTATILIAVGIFMLGEYIQNNIYQRKMAEHEASLEQLRKKDNDVFTNSG